jgi:hypothetical protein
MSSPITATSPAHHIPPSVAPPPEVAVSAHAATGPKAVEPTAAPSAASRGQQQAALSRLLTKYAYDQSHGSDAQTIATLGKQILAAAKGLGQHVTLPQAPASSPASPPPPTAGAAHVAGKVNVTA